MIRFLKKKLKVFKKLRGNQSLVPSNVGFNEKRKLKFCYLYVSGTTNNIFLTLVKKNGDVIGSLSSGKFMNMKGKRKKCGTFVAQKMGYILGLKGFYLDYIKVDVLIKSSLISRLIYSIMNGLHHSGVQVRSLINYYPYARNGVKLKKVRRK